MATKQNSKPKGKSNAQVKFAPDDFKKITSVAIALKSGGYDAKKDLPNVSKMRDKDKADYMLAQAELMYVTEAINRMPDGSAYQPDFTGNETHYEPWHNIQTTKGNKTNPAGFGFSNSGYGVWSSAVGARLLFRDYARWEHASKHFEKLYIRCKLMPAKKENRKTNAPKKK